MAVADAFDALTHERPYKKAWSREEAIAEIERQKGRQFDPDIVEAFLFLFARGEIEAPLRYGVSTTKPSGRISA